MQEDHWFSAAQNLVVYDGIIQENCAHLIIVIPTFNLSLLFLYEVLTLSTLPDW